MGIDVFRRESIGLLGIRWAQPQPDHIAVVVVEAQRQRIRLKRDPTDSAAFFPAKDQSQPNFPLGSHFFAGPRSPFSPSFIQRSVLIGAKRSRHNFHPSLLIDYDEEVSHHEAF